MTDAVFIIGASGRTGAAICRRLAAAGRPYVPIVRDAARWRAHGLPGERRVADLTDTRSLAYTLEDATAIISCAHARHTAAILEATAESTRYVLFGSTRRFSRFPDGHGLGVLAGEKALLSSGRAGVMLHPSMIYGDPNDGTVRRLAGMIRRLPFIPLPNGGRALVQPIHQADAAAAAIAALDRAWSAPRAITIAGADAVPYADFVRAVARAAGLPRPRILPMPLGLLALAAAIMRPFPRLPQVDMAELRRLTEDKAFSIEPMIGTLGITPMGLTEGLSLTFRPPPA